MKKVILIFGAGSGIGEALFQNLGKRYMKENLELFGFSRRGREYDQFFFQNENLSFDLTQSSHFDRFELAYKKLMLELKKATHPFELVVYFAQGDGLFAPISFLQDSEIISHFQLNLFGSMSILRRIADSLSSFSQATIVFCASTASKMGFPNATAYCASKHAVSGLAKALREEWKELGVKVINANLGAISTSIWDDRPEFSKKDMISKSDAAEYLASLSDLPKTLYLDEVFVTPRKGIL
jgi:short-subunit dehydrogenase